MDQDTEEVKCNKCPLQNLQRGATKNSQQWNAWVIVDGFETDIENHISVLEAMCEEEEKKSQNELW